MESLGARVNGLTPAGAKWLTVALDPMHDSRVVPDGLPDVDTRPSVVIKKEMSVQVSKPTAAASTWSFSVSVGPDMNTVNMFPGSFCLAEASNGFQQVQQNWNGAAYLNVNMPDFSDWRGALGFGGTIMPRGFVNCDVYDTDVACFQPDGSGAYAIPLAVKNLSPFGSTSGPITSNQDFKLGQSWSRVIAGGVELINTTAEIDKQGLITLGEVPNSVVEGSCAMWDASDAANPPPSTGAGNPIRDGYHKVPFVQSAMAASSIAECQAYSRSTQLPAKDGVYVPFRIDASKNGFQRPRLMHRVASNSTSQFKLAAGAGGAAPANPNSFANPNLRYELAAGSGLSLSLPAKAAQLSPVQCSTILCTGLSQKTTFTVRAVYYIEIAPQLNDPTYGSFVYSARPSPSLDRQALDLYATLSQALPIGVPQTMNPAGEWWDIVKGAITRILPAVSDVASMVPHPIASAIGMGARALSNLTGTSRASSAASNRSASASTRKKRKSGVKKVTVARLKKK